jgi:hypothetical protein
MRRWANLQINRTRWKYSITLTLMIVLSLGVFLWGTAYKFSLYKASPIYNKVPEAKLSTETGTANKDQTEHATVPANVPAFPSLFALALVTVIINPGPARFYIELCGKLTPLSTLYFPPARFLRPPPFSFYG